MPSREHELFVELLRTLPEIAVQLLEGAGVAAKGTPKIVDSAAAATIGDHRADLVMVLPALVIVVEVQLNEDKEKSYSWPVYVTSARARHRRDAVLLVITDNGAVIRAAERGVHIGGGMVLRPLVAGPKAARGSVLLRGLLATNDEGAIDGALAGATVLPDALKLLYWDVLSMKMSPETKAKLEKMMETHEVQSEFLRRILTREREEGTADSVRDVLRARGLEIDDVSEAKLAGCHDLATLRRWLRRAATCERLADVFD